MGKKLLAVIGLAVAAPLFVAMAPHGKSPGCLCEPCKCKSCQCETAQPRLPETAPRYQLAVTPLGELIFLDTQSGRMWLRDPRRIAIMRGAAPQSFSEWLPLRSPLD